MPNGSFQLPILPRFGDPTTQLQDFATRDYVDNAILAAATASGYALRGSANTFTAANTFSANGALSAPAVSFTGTPITGGTATTTKPLVLIETAGATSTAWSTSGTLFGLNSAGGFAGNVFDIQRNGTSTLKLDSTGILTSTGPVVVTNNIRISSDSSILSFGASNDIIFSRKGPANPQLGAADAAAPVAQTLSVQSVVAGTTDTAGANWTLNGSRGTGTGAGGEVIIQTAAASTTGNTQNSLIPQIRVQPSGGFRVGGAGSTSPWIFPFTGNTLANYGTPTTSGAGISLYSYAAQDAIALTGQSYTGTSGGHRHVAINKSFAPTSGTGTYTLLDVSGIINQTGGANGITRGIYVNPTLTAAADFRALEISAGNVVLPKTVTAGGTTGAQTIDKVTGSVNFAAAATSLVVTNSYVTTSSIIVATVATNDTTMKSVAVVAAAGSFTLHASAAATAETRVNFIVIN